MKPLDVAVVGGGTAGAASAIFLSRAGHRVTLHERVAEPGPLGAGIVLQPSGLEVLRALGLDAPILAAGARLDRLRCRTRRRGLFELHYDRVGGDLFGLGLHRGVLFQTLHGALQASDVDLQLGRDVLRLEADGDRHHVRHPRGRSGPYDLVVVADGARSVLREQVFPHSTTRSYPWGALWFVGPLGDLPPELYQVVDGTREMVGLLPTGLGPEPSRGPLASLFYSVALRDVAALRATPLAAWKAHVCQRLPAAARLVEQLVSWDQLLFAAYHDVVMPRWHDRGVVLLGDAAHATSPQLGQGCNLALGDAAALATALERASCLPTALASYSRERRAVLAFYQRASRWLTPLFHSDDSVLGALRDATFPIFSRLPFFERRMIETMAGLSTGWLSSRATG